MMGREAVAERFFPANGRFQWTNGGSDGLTSGLWALRILLDEAGEALLRHPGQLLDVRGIDRREVEARLALHPLAQRWRQRRVQRRVRVHRDQVKAHVVLLDLHAAERDG